MGREEGEMDIGNRLQLIEDVDSRSIQPIADFHPTRMSSTLNAHSHPGHSYDISNEWKLAGRIRPTPSITTVP